MTTRLDTDQDMDTLRATSLVVSANYPEPGMSCAEQSDLRRSKSNLRGSIRNFFSKMSHKRSSKDMSEERGFPEAGAGAELTENSSFHVADKRINSFCSVRSRSSDNQGRLSRHSQASHILGQGLASLKSSSFKKLYGHHSRIQLLDETWEDWQEKYQRGDVNLSKLERPTCFNGFGHMAAPLYKFETTRLRAVEKLKDASLWKSELDWLIPELLSVLHQHRLKLATVSVVEQNVQQIVWQTGIGQHFQSVSRDLSLDGHTLLSKDYFALLDCSNDWRTRLNPLVHGPPFIKFYFGVNIMFDRVPIGCIAVCDPYLKTRAAPALIEQMNRISSRLSQGLETSFYRRPGVHSRIQWNEDRQLSVTENSESEDAGLSRDSETGSLLSLATTQYSPTKSTSSLNLSLSENSGMNPNIGLPEFSATLHPITCKSALQPFEVFESLLRCLTVPQAIKKACKIIQHNLGADVTYLAECRVKQSASFNPQISSRTSEDSMSPTDHHMSDAKVKLVGNCTPQVSIDINSLVSSQSQLIVSAICSRYGIQFMNGHSSQDTLWSGMVMPLRRQEPFAANETNAANHQPWGGGFVMAVFYIGTQRKFSPGDQLFMKKVVRALENILTCFDELRPSN